MIILKNSELELSLLTISTFSAPKEGETQTLVSGLLSENITLGTKRGLQKIHKGVFQAYKDLQEDLKDLQKECGEDKEKLVKEVGELFEESVKIDVEPIKFSFIENISSKINYNFDIIDKIAV